MKTTGKTPAFQMHFWTNSCEGNLQHESFDKSQSLKRKKVELSHSGL